MAIYLKKFATQAAYEAAQSSLILPNVSLIDETNGMKYNPYVDPCKQYDYVEIDGVKWATKNVGACNITDTGLYFQWGDTQGYTAEQVGSGEGQKYFAWEDYKYGNGTSSPKETGMTKYNPSDGKTVLDASDDAAVANWGSGWRMPTFSEYFKLKNAVTTAWTADYQGSGVAGMICTDKTDSSKVLFFPAAGSCSYGKHESEGKWGYYWLSTLATSSKTSAWNLQFLNGVITVADISRLQGFSVRPVAAI